MINHPAPSSASTQNEFAAYRTIAFLVFCLLTVHSNNEPLLADTSSIYSVEQFYDLSNEAAREGVKVHIEGTVLYSDPDWGLFWLQDETGRIFIPIREDFPAPAARTSAVVTGTTKLVNGAPEITELQIRKTGQAKLPPSRVLTPLNIRGEQQEHARVHGAGTVIQAEMAGESHLRLVVAFLRRYKFRVTVNNCRAKDLEGLLGSHIEVSGCATRYSNVNHPDLAPMQLYVPDMADLAVFLNGPKDVFDSPRINLKDATFEYQSRRDPRLVRMSGRVKSQSEPNSLLLTDGKTNLRVKLREKSEFEEASQVDVVGIVWRDEEKNKLLLDYAVARPMQEDTPVSLESDATLPVLRSVQSIRALTPEMASEKYPIEIHGVVTYYDPVWRVLFVNDETGGIYVDAKSQIFPIQLGDRVVVRGVSDPGGFSSMVVARRVQRLAMGRLPGKRIVAAARVLSGAEDSQWLTLTANVTSVERSQKNLVLNLQGIEKNFPFHAVLCGGAKHFSAKNWVGSEIEISGVCGTKANANLQAIGVYFHIPNLDHVRFLSEANSDPFALRRVAIEDLLKFDPKVDERPEQVKISGVVTYTGARGQIAIQDDDQGILLRLKKLQLPEIGDRVEVIGYPILNSTQDLQATDWRKTGSAPLPPSRRITVSDIANQSSDGQFVSIQALVLRNNSDSVSPGLSLQSEGIVFSADLSSTTTDEQWTRLRDGSTIQLEGVLDVIDDGWGTTESFRLLCPNRAKVEVIQAAPIWNSTYSRMLFVGLSILIGAGFLWVITLRRSVNSQREQIQNELRVRAKLTERHNKLIDNAGELIFSIRPDGHFVTVNPATTRVLHSTIPDLLGCQISDFLTVESVQALQDSIRRLSREQSRTELELTTRDSLILETAIYFQPETSGEKRIQCIARDVSERRRLESQMRHMQKMESIGQLAAGIAHDYNNLMTVVLGNSELTLECGELNRDDTNAVLQIKDAAERAASLTRQLLAFSRRQIMNMTVFQPKELLAGLVDMLQRLIGESIHLTCDFGEDVPCIQADRGMLEQVIVNMAVNARDAMPDGGHLKFTLRHHHVPSASSAQNFNVSPGEYVQITVADTGDGIASEDIPNVFEPFFTTKEVGKGTGLGLSTAFGIIRQHKGWIDVDSTIDKGTTFNILLPVAVTEESTRYKASRYPIDSAPPRGMETIMLVEDDQEVRQTTTRLLTLFGYEIIEARNGREALRTWHQLRNRIDMIITDMIMPGGMSGYDMAQEIKSFAPDTRLIYCSGYSEEIAKLSALDVTERLLPKPYENRTLLHLVRDLLDLNAEIKT
ncbi:MAG: ATP-binding protein [Aureliella sp.]